MATKRTTHTYVARCAREGRWWIITIPDLDGVFTHARSLEAARELAADAIALWLDVPVDWVDVELEVAGMEGALREWREARAARLEAERLSEESAKRARAAVARLNGMTVRDIATLLDISFQRVQQLQKPGPPKAVAKVARKGKPRVAVAGSAGTRVVRSNDHRRLT